MALTDAQLERTSIVLDGDLATDNPRGITSVVSDLSRIAGQVRSMIGEITVVRIAEEPGYVIDENLAGSHRDISEAAAMNALQTAKARMTNLAAELVELLAP